MKSALFALLVLAANVGESKPSQNGELIDLILDARNIAESHGDEIWDGYFDAPFGILLVEEKRERLFCHKGSLDGFESTGTNDALSCQFGERPTSYPTNFLASFPAVAGIPTIVIGTPAATEKTFDGWVLTILHEHFHQMQFAWSGYYTGISGLDLDGGDETGMWMLNYPFPYENDTTAGAFQIMAGDLVEVLNARGTDDFYEKLNRYWLSRESARETVSEADWRYFELQLWQEGVARWTESAISALSEDLVNAANEANNRILRELSSLDLANQKRTAVYPIGAAEASLLDAVDSGWRITYWSEPFSLGPQIEKLIVSSSHDTMPEGQ